MISNYIVLVYYAYVHTTDSKGLLKTSLTVTGCTMQVYHLATCCSYNYGQMYKTCWGWGDKSISEAGGLEIEHPRRRAAPPYSTYMYFIIDSSYRGLSIYDLLIYYYYYPLATV